jgi:hypothetical protein
MLDFLELFRQILETLLTLRLLPCREDDCVFPSRMCAIHACHPGKSARQRLYLPAELTA